MHPPAGRSQCRLQSSPTASALPPSVLLTEALHACLTVAETDNTLAWSLQAPSGHRGSQRSEATEQANAPTRAGDVDILSARGGKTRRSHVILVEGLRGASKVAASAGEWGSEGKGKGGGMPCSVSGGRSRAE